MTTKTTRYPWADLGRPNDRDLYTARRVGSDLNPERKRISWGMSFDDHPVLLVEYQCTTWRPAGLPSFRNILVKDHRDSKCLIIELASGELSEFFYKVCLDIIAVIQDVPPSIYRRVSILRLEKWSLFLRLSQHGMSVEAQKGLIGELLFLERLASQRYPIGSALAGWVGPENSPRDFCYGQTFIEVKSKKGSSNRSITVSSESQLDVGSSEELFLYVVELNRASSDNEASFSVSDVVTEVRGLLESPLLVAELDRKLSLVGYFDEDSYSDTCWTEGDSFYYRVEAGFPRIDSSDCMSGISKVSYQIDLDCCSEYQVDKERVLESMR